MVIGLGVCSSCHRQSEGQASSLSVSGAPQTCAEEWIVAPITRHSLDPEQDQFCLTPALQPQNRSDEGLGFKTALDRSI